MRAPQVLVLLQTAHVLTRPYCIVELLTAIDHGVPIVGVAVASPRPDERYDFEKAADFLRRLDTELERCTPGSARILAEHGYPDLAAAGAKLHRVLPKVISLSLNFAASKRVLAAMKEDVRDEVKRLQELGDL